jgi:hypothetical protein
MVITPALQAGDVGSIPIGRFHPSNYLEMTYRKAHTVGHELAHIFQPRDMPLAEMQREANRMAALLLSDYKASLRGDHVLRTR